MTKHLLFVSILLIVLPGHLSAEWVVTATDKQSVHAPGDTVFVDLHLTGSGADIFALGLDFIFPDSMLAYQEVDFSGTLLENWVLRNVNQVNSNAIRLAALSTSSGISTPQTGLLLKTKFVVKPSATGAGIFLVQGFTDGLKYAVSVPDTFNIWQNSPPEIRSEPNTFCLEDSRYEYDVDVFDPDLGDQLVFQFLTAPAWLEINPATGLISGTPQNADVGQTLVSFFVSDQVNPRVQQMWQLTVQNVNDPPTAPATLLAPAWGDTTGYENTRFLWRAGSDPDFDDLLTYHIEIYGDQALSNLIFNRDGIADTSFAFNRIPDYASKFLSGIDYFWRVQTVDLAGTGSEFTSTRSFKLVEGKITKIDGTEKIPVTFQLFPNFPNPFNPHTEIQYQLPRAVKVRLQIFNLAGQQVRSVIDSNQPAGNYRLRWDGRDETGNSLPSGTYILRLAAGEFFANRKMLLIK